MQACQMQSRQWYKPLTIMAWSLALSLTTSTGWSQETCEEPARCMTRERVSALVDAKCIKDRAKAERVGELTADLKASETQTQFCEGRLAQIIAAQPETAWRSPWWLRWGLDIGVPVLATATGITLGAGAPLELSVGLLVGTTAGIIGRLILELLD